MLPLAKGVGTTRVLLALIVPIETPGPDVPVAQNAEVPLFVDRAQAEPVTEGGVSPAALVSTIGTVQESTTIYRTGTIVVPMSDR